MDRARLRVWWRRLCRFALYSATFLVAALIVWHVYLSVRLGQASGRLRAMGYPTTLEELNAWVAIPEGERNAAELYLEAFEALDRSGFDSDKLPDSSHVNAPPIGEPYAEEVIAEVARYVGQNQAALALAHEAATLGHSRLFPDYSDPAIVANWGYTEPLLILQRLLQLEAIHHAEAGRTEECAEAIGVALALADAMFREPDLIAFMFGTTNLANVWHWVLPRLIENGQLDRATLDDLSESHLELDILHGVENSILGEALEERLWWSWKYFRHIESEWTRNPEVERWTWFDTILSRIFLTGFQLSGIPKALDIRERETGIRQLEKLDILRRRGYINILPPMDIDPILGLVIGRSGLPPRALDRLHGGMARNEAERRCTIAALAIERFRMDTGRQVESLQELVPDYMDDVPLDPFDGEPLRYQLAPEGYAVYSVGPAGEDLGGYDFENREFGTKGHNERAPGVTVEERNVGFVVRR